MKTCERVIISYSFLLRLDIDRVPLQNSIDRYKNSRSVCGDSHTKKKKEALSRTNPKLAKFYCTTFKSNWIHRRLLFYYTSHLLLYTSVPTYIFIFLSRQSILADVELPSSMTRPRTQLLGFVPPTTVWSHTWVTALKLLSVFISTQIASSHTDIEFTLQILFSYFKV